MAAVSSDAFLAFEDEPVPVADWADFAAARGLRYDPHVVGHNVYRHAVRQIQVRFGADTAAVTHEDGRIDFAQCQPPPEATQITFSTHWMGEACPEVAALAVAAWHRFGGQISASPEIRNEIRALRAEAA